MLHGEKTNIDI